MTNYPILFNQTPESLRRIGARGGRTHARNWRLRQHNAVAGPSVTPHLPPVETTAQAIAKLDAQFPWLRHAEQRIAGRKPCPRARVAGLRPGVILGR